MKSTAPWTYVAGDVVINGWRIVDYAGRTGRFGLPVYIARCPNCLIKTEELTGPEMKARLHGCFACRWAEIKRKLRSPNRRRKYHAGQVVGRIKVMDSGGKAVPGGRVIFYTCRCHCRRSYAWPTNLITSYGKTGCPACRKKPRKAKQ